MWPEKFSACYIQDKTRKLKIRIQLWRLGHSGLVLVAALARVTLFGASRHALQPGARPLRARRHWVRRYQRAYIVQVAVIECPEPRRSAGDAIRHQQMRDASSLTAARVSRTACVAARLQSSHVWWPARGDDLSRGRGRAHRGRSISKQRKRRTARCVRSPPELVLCRGVAR